MPVPHSSIGTPSGLRGVICQYNLLHEATDEHTILDKDIELMRGIVENEMPRKPSNEEILSSLLAIDGVPVIEEKRLEKLLDVLVKKLSKITVGTTKENSKVFQFDIKKESIKMPFGEDGLSKGFIFVQYKTAAEAEMAGKLLNNKSLDAKHTFKTMLMSQLEKYSNVPDTYTPPTPPEVGDEYVDLQYWLLNKHCLDQFAMYHENKVSVFWNGKFNANEILNRENWTQHYVSWSPKGSYLATVHHQGVALWGGERWEKIGRFHHPGVKLLDFSPCERYMCTWSNEIQDNRDDPNTIIVWNIRTGAKIRGFMSGIGPGENLNWPVFKWNHNGDYVARSGPDFISVFKSDSCKTIDRGNKESIKVPDLKAFAWSPTDNCLAYWMPERGQLPARVVLFDINLRQEIRSKNLFNVQNCMLHWQESGDHLCVKVDAISKTKKQYTSFEVFDIRSKGCPVDNIELQEQVHAFSWEPCNPRFTIIHGEQAQTSMSVYAVKKTPELGAHVKLVYHAEKKDFNTIFWSPAGSNFVIAKLRGSNRSLEFWEVNANDEVSLLSQDEHYMATHVEWDPTGRYVMTVVSAWAQPTEHGYHVWSSQGRLMQKATVNKLYQIKWRPRPKTLLNAAEIKNVRKSVKEFGTQFDREDHEAAFNISAAERNIRTAQLDSWTKILAKMQQYHDQEKERYELLAKDTELEGWVENLVVVETFLNETVKIM